MKKILYILIAAVMLLTLAACSEKTTDGAGDAQQTPNATKGATGQQGAVSTEGEQQTIKECYGLTFSGVKLVPGEAFDAANLPDAATVMEVPSCAFEGTDNLYNYETFELTAYDEGNGETIYSIYLIDPNTPTDEGLFLGETMTEVELMYGTDYVKKDNEVTYTKGDTQLILILQEDTVFSIEYRLAQ
jgi:predicted small secreted protein